MDYSKYDDINLKKFEILNAPESLVKEYADSEFFPEKKSKYSQEELSFLKKFYPYIGAAGCKKKLKRTTGSIHCKASQLKIKNSDIGVLNCYSYENFIKNPSPLEAYVFGFLWADGTIGTNKSKKWNNTIKLKIVNEDFLQIKNQFMKSAFWRYRVSEVPPYKDQAVVEIADRLFHDFLTKMDCRDKSNGIGPNKILDFLGEDLKHHFLRGFFDGDGSFVYGNGCDKKVSFHSCKEQDWSFLKNILDKLNISSWISTTDHNSALMITNFSGIEKLYNYIYKDSDIHLKRKKKRFEKYFDKIATSRPNKTSKYRGVSSSKDKWIMQVYDKSKKRSIAKHFDNELDAAKEYDRLADKLFGSSARLNFKT